MALIEHSSWVIFLAILLLTYHKKLPILISKLESFKAGGFEVKFSKKLHTKFSSNQIKTFAGLNFEEMDVFLMVSFLSSAASYQTDIDKNIFKKHMLRLEEVGLLTILNPDDDGRNLHRELTKDGHELRSLLTRNIGDLLESVADSGK